MQLTIMKKPYWLPFDADNDAKYICETSLKVKEVYKKLKETKNAEIVLIAEACFSGRVKVFYSWE